MSQSLRWTSERPTVEGLYWFRDGSAVTIVQVSMGTRDAFYHEDVEWFGVAGKRPLNKLRGEFAGPITPPERGE